MTGNEALLERVCALLDERRVAYERLAHPVATRADEFARLRGLSLAAGAKALVMKANQDFLVAVVSAATALDNRALRAALGASRLRFATVDELQALTGCEPGQVPPFGRPIFDLPLVADRALALQPRVAFTAGTHTDSIHMTGSAWLAVARPRQLDFARPTGPC